MTGMRAVLSSTEPGGDLRTGEATRPTAGPGQTLVRFEASTINPADLKIGSGLIRPRNGKAPWTLGWDLVGRVESGDEFTPGTQVLGMSAMATTGIGTWSEWVALPSISLAAVSSDVDPARFAQLPLAGLTALQTVQDARVRPSETVAVVGAGGAVGAFVLQLLAAQRIPVIAVVRDPAVATDLVRMAATSVVDHLGPASVDVVVEAAGVDSSAAVRPGGRYIEVVPDTSADHLADGVERSTVRVAESGEKLDELINLESGGVLTLSDPLIFSLFDIDAAFTAFQQRSGRRIALTLPSDWTTPHKEFRNCPIHPPGRPSV